MELEKEQAGGGLKHMMGIWHSWQLDVPSLAFRLPTDDVYDYKLPYIVAEAPCCARINPYLYFLDVYPWCPAATFGTCAAGAASADVGAVAALCGVAAGVAALGAVAYYMKGSKAAGQLPFIDVVNQHDGHQVRHRHVTMCCRTPRVLTFADGHYIGRVNRTMRCCNRCLVCLEDIQKKPVLQLGLHDENNNQIARIDREGKGCCCTCKIKFPMKCTGFCFTCATCTCMSKPSMVEPFCGFADCDPVFCDCCVKGNLSCGTCKDCPFLCICLPLCVPAIWCPCPTIETTRFPNTGTVSYQDIEVVDSQTQQQVAIMQALYRGNYPSAYTHDEDKSFKVTANAASGRLGMLLSSVAAGMNYTMGGSIPAFEHVRAKPKGRSPSFGGYVETAFADQMRALVDGKLGEDMVVNGAIVLGPKLNGTQVRGWRLTKLGFSSAMFTIKGCCSCCGKKRPMRSMKSLKEVQDMVAVALEQQVGDSGTTFMMQFECPDHEKQVLTKGAGVVVNANIAGETGLTDNSFNPPGGGFIGQLEAVELACTCLRVCRGCCNTRPDKTFCCRCPIYARPVGGQGNEAAREEAWKQKDPRNTVMVTVPKQQFMVK